METEDEPQGERAAPSRMLETIIDAVPAILAYVDREERYRYANPAYGRVIGRPTQEIIGETVGNVVPDVADGDVSESLRRALAGQPQTFDLTVEDENGRERIWDTWFRPVDERDGNGVVVYATDVTGERRLEKRLRHAQRLVALGEMAGEVAHDFNNLISSILLPCQLLQDMVSADAAEELRAMEATCGRATALAQRLLRFAKFGAVERSDQDLSGIVRQMQPILRRLVGRDVSMTLDLDDGIEEVTADQVELEQIILNLVMNAKHAMSDGGHLTIRTARLEEPEAGRPASTGEGATERVLLAVEDDGVGMDEATRARALDPYFSTRSENEGTGLGLATVQSVVSTLGGSVSVESAPGEGSEFRIVLPTTTDGSEVDTERA